VLASTDPPHTLPVRPDLSSLRGSGLTWSVILWIVFATKHLVTRRFSATYPQAITVVPFMLNAAETPCHRWGSDRGFYVDPIRGRCPIRVPKDPGRGGIPW